MDCVIGIDIGTTSTIGVLISLPDRILASVSRPVTLFSPHQGWAEEDPEQWWANVREIVPELLARSGVPGSAVRAIGTTGMLPATIILDADGRLLRRSIQQSDGRVGAQVAELMAEVDGREFLARAGNGINQQLLAAKLRWISAHEPEIFGKIATVMGSYDYINWRLTGRKTVERNWAVEAGFVDIGRMEIDDRLVALAGIDRQAVPPLVASHEVIGPLQADVAAALGLEAGIPVVGGAADHIASAYAAGVTQPGDVLLKFGGAADILISTETFRPDPRMFLDLHLIPGLYMPNGCMASGGSALNWFVQNFAGGEAEAAGAAGLSLHQHLDRLAETVGPGADGVQIVPYFLGEKTPLHDPSARGIIHGLSLNHGLSHLWRALLEGFGYAFRHHIEVFNDMGHPTRRFLASDGGSNSRLWMQICADILQQPIQLLRGHPGSSLGAAWMAVIGAGLSEDWGGVANFITQGERIEPRAEFAPLYDRGYQQFRGTYRALSAA